MSNNTSSDALVGLFSSLFAGGFTIGVFLLILLFILLVFLLLIAIFIVTEIPVYKMAKNAGFPHPWLAFVPYACSYVMFALPHKEFNIFNWIKTHNRTNAFLWFLGISFVPAVIYPLVMVVAFIPLIGSFLATGLNGLISLVVNFFIYIFLWRARYDLLATFGAGENTLWVSIVSLFVPFVWIVFLFILMNNEPDYGNGNYDSYYTQSA